MKTQLEQYQEQLEKSRLTGNERVIEMLEKKVSKLLKKGNKMSKKDIEKWESRRRINNDTSSFDKSIDLGQINRERSMRNLPSSMR